MSSTAITADLESVRQHLGLEVLDTLADHSQAGVLFLPYAAIFPRRVENLVAIGSYMLGFDHMVSFEPLS